MKRPCVRFTLRGMMIAVAILTLPLISARLLIQRMHYIRMAISYQKREIESRRREVWSGKMALKGYVSPKAAAADRARTEYFRQMRAKHGRAARSPWLPVAPDPPEP